MSVDHSLLLDRGLHACAGALIGFVLGYIKNCVPDHNSSHTDKRKKSRMSQRNEKGAITLPRWLSMQNIGMVLIVVMVAWSAFQSSRAVSAVTDQQETRDRETNCTSQILFRTIEALNDRTEFSGAQADANITLQQSQLKLITAILRPEITDEEAEAVFTDYLDSLRGFVEAIGKVTSSQKSSPYPTEEEFASCLERARNGEEIDPQVNKSNQE